MTKPRKWPHHADTARLEAIALQDAIHAEARNAQRLIEQGQGLSAVIRLGEIADKAMISKSLLQRAKEAPEAVP